MGADTKIEWADHTFNPWMGCTKVSPACAHCYAETLMDHRYGKVQWGAGKPRVRTSEANWRLPLRWNAAAKRHDDFMEGTSTKPRVFCASLADWLDDDGVPIAWLADLLALIHATPNLVWMLLTKRPENWGDRIAAAMLYMDRAVPRPTEQEQRVIEEAARIQTSEKFRELTARFQRSKASLMLGDWLEGRAPANVWIGATVENQECADRRIPELLGIPARVRFLSCEPLLGPVEFSDVTRRVDAVAQLGKKALHGIHWVIAGGESGAGARPSHPDWFRSLRDQCAAAKVAFHFKQWGEFAPRAESNPSAKVQRFYFDGEEMARVGKKAAGRMLDGREWNEVPA